MSYEKECSKGRTDIYEMLSMIIRILWIISIFFMFCENYIAPFSPPIPKTISRVCSDWYLVYLWLPRKRILWETYRNPL